MFRWYSRLVILLALAASGDASAETSPSQSPATVERPSGDEPSAGHGPRCTCSRPACRGVVHLQFPRDFLQVGQPGQYIGPHSFWTVIVPPFPPRPPAPGEKPPVPQPWKPLFFDNDFRYLDKPDNTVHNPFDFLKRNKFPKERIVTDFGGEFRWQGRVESNRRLTGEENNFNLFRERLYLNTWFDDLFRFYGEVYWADASRQTVPPVFFDIDHGDVNNFFGELRLLRSEEDDGWWSFRYGWHEELLLGNQRLVSPLDWANVRRSFDLIPHLLYRGKTWAIDGFWSRPNIILARQLNQPNYEQQFFGAYATYKGRPDRYYDLYYLGLLASDQNTTTFNGETGNFAVHTLGTRLQGEQNNWLWEGEFAYQFGHHFNVAQARDVPRNAGMATGGIGRRFADWALTPELWFYFDYASGNRQPGSNDYATFNQLFPLGHKYFGYMDIVGRQNILDPNVNLKFFMGKRANLLFWYHIFHLASARDALYNGAGTPIRFDPTGQAGRYVGNELDIVMNIFVNPNTDLQIGFCQFWAGTFVERTAQTPAQAQDGNFFYTQFTFRF